ncbi:MAG TPA: response regulator transcription factor [Thermoanaerobaculia bacterium]|nr:response regulator transcription factor [Thermoanaerobaculia bacterium]
MRILVVEDEPVLADALVDVLEDEHYAVDLSLDGDGADERMGSGGYDLVILDWKIPPPDGIELLRRWRGQGEEVPVLMLTGIGGIPERVDALDTGADDFLAKPFAFEELLARVRSLLRRRPRTVKANLEAGDLVMDRASHSVTRDGKPIDLSPREFALLEYLLAHKDEVVDRQQLAERVWGEDERPQSNLVDVTIHRLRRKIDHGRKGRLLTTVKGVGYMLRSEAE